MSVYNAYLALSGTIDADLALDEALSRRTTLRIGGPAALTCVCHTYGALSRCLDVLASEGVDWVVLGKGSDILASDRGYPGCVVLLGREFRRMGVSDGTFLTVGSAAMVSKLLTFSLSNELSGLEILAGIPGTLGGAVSTDAGTRHHWIGALVHDAVVLRPGEGMYRYKGHDIEWGYRQTSLPSSEILLEVTLSLCQGDKEGIAAEANRMLRRRGRTQPMGRPCAGETFRDPGDGSASEMLEECGVAGYSVGAAQVSPASPNFIVNNGGATADDVCSLMKAMHDKVRDAYDVDLQAEVKTLGLS